MKFTELLRKIRGADFIPPDRLLAIDPGETTGWALFKQGKLSAQGQIKSVDMPCESIEKLFKETCPNEVVYEDYRVYAHKASSHSWNDLFTPKLIGMIEFCCYLGLIPVHTQMASAAKGFCKDKKLKDWGYYIQGQKHSRDAIRHGCYHLLFHNRRT